MTTLNKVDEIYHGVLEELLSAPIRGDRTGTGTHSLFGKQLRFTNLETEFPLISTKKVWFYGVFHELKWMLSGDSNIKYLVDNNVSIWSDWPLKCYNQKNPHNQLTKKEFEDKIRSDAYLNGSTLRFSEKWGDCGPVYGRQWRKWEGYDVRSTEIDQIADILGALRNSPESRRMIVNAWNVADIPAMIPSGLPPCHMMFQFYTRPLTMKERLNRSKKYKVDEQWVADSHVLGKNKQKLDDEGIPERYLDCQVYIRSNDTFLGASFNIAQYALLTHLMSATVNMVPGELVYTIGDFHLYTSHVEQAKEQLKRSSYIKEPPMLTVKHSSYTDPKDYTWEDLYLHGYESHNAIKAPIAV